MYIFKNNEKHQISNIVALKNGAQQIITHIYAVVDNSIKLIWALSQEVISSVFGRGYWMNDQSWNNEDVWKNEP